MPRPPRFWNAEAGALSCALSPAGTLYHAGVRLRFALARPTRAPVPVVCIGNPGLGGGGKTPTALAIARRLIALGATPHFLSRGYGGALAGPLLVDPARHDAAAVGDEPLLLARLAPAHIARDRAAGALAAAAAGAGIIVMDDGYQNPTLAKNLALLIVDGASGIGNGRVFPAGPLREGLSSQLARASAAIVVGPGTPGEDFARRGRKAGVRVLTAHLVPAPAAPDLSGRPVVAFCGIARPEKFFDSLRAAGAIIAGTVVFDDHHAFDARDCARILETCARHKGATPVTTEKDLVRLTNRNDPGGVLRKTTLILPVELVFDEPAMIDDLLRPLVTRV